MTLQREILRWVRRACFRWPVVVLIAAAATAAAQDSSARVPPKVAPHHSRQTSRSTRKAPPPAAIPESINANGEAIPVSEIIPRTDSAQKQLEQIIAKLDSAGIDNLTASLKTLDSSVDDSRRDTENVVKHARSPLQLTEPRVVWARHRSSLETLSADATSQTATLEAVRQQARDAGQAWENMASAADAAGLPAEIKQRIESVRKTADHAREVSREQAAKLIEIQVQISNTRKTIDDMIARIDTTDAALRDQLFVLDSPPLWFAQGTKAWSETRQQIGDYYTGGITRALTFLESYRSPLFFYGVLSLGIFGFVRFLSRLKLSAEDTGIDAHYLACLRHPIAITALFVLAAFGIFFPKAPSDLVRLTRTAMEVPVVLIGFSFVGRRMRIFLVGAAVSYLIDILTIEFLSGTLLGRYVLLLLTVSLFLAYLSLLRKGGMLRTFFAEQGMTLMGMWSFVAALLLFVSIVANIVGNMSLGSLLGDGTIISIYWSVALYVIFASVMAVAAGFTASEWGQRSRALRLHRVLVNRKLARYLRVGYWILWFYIILLGFQLSTQTFQAARKVLYYELKLGAVSLSLLDVTLFVLVLMVSSMIAEFIRFMLNEEILPRTSIDSGVAEAGSRLTYTALLILGVILALGAAGLELSKLTVLTGAFGVGVGFGLQTLVSNFVSGVIISLERPMRIGDLIEVSSLFGEVKSIGFRSSTVRTFEGADVIVPNSEFITKSFVNWSLEQKLRRTDIEIGVAYGTDPSRVLEILTRLVAGHTGVYQSLAPLITFDQFGQNSLTFTLRFWSKMDVWLQVRSELNVLINDEFQRNGIVIPIPQRDIHLKLEELPSTWDPRGIARQEKSPQLADGPPIPLPSTARFGP